MNRDTTQNWRLFRSLMAVVSTSLLLMACGGGGTTTATYTAGAAGSGTSPTTITSFTPTSAQAGIATQFTVVGTSIPLTAVVLLSGGSCASPTSVTALGFLVQCTPGPTLGSVTAVVNTNTAANSGWWIGQQSLTITAAGSSVSLLTDTGITANQCYGAGSDALISCLSPAAIALNDKQDGMVGRDVAYSDGSDGWLGSSYSVSTSTTTTVTPTSTTTTTTTDTNCIKDNVTGLTWQRASTTLTVIGGVAQGAEALGHVNAANTATLCGYADWRLPTTTELQSLLNYGLSNASPAIDMNWFALTLSRWYTTGTYQSGVGSNRWMVDFAKGRVDGALPQQLRLVR